MAKAEKLTWIVRSQDLSSKNSVRWNTICGALRINWTIRPNLTSTCIIWLFQSVCWLITNFSKLQMLHGCRTDLIFKCLVYSNKDRNFHSYLQKIKFLRTYTKNYILVIVGTHYKNIKIYKIHETKMTSKSLWLLRGGLYVCYNETVKG